MLPLVRGDDVWERCHGFGKAAVDRCADGHNPLCGDTVRVYLRIEAGVIEEISFEGEGCAICTASCSLMTEAIRGRRVDEAEALFAGFHEMLTGLAAEQGVELGKLRVFEGVRSVAVELTWNSPRGPEMMSEAARLELGFL